MGKAARWVRSLLSGKKEQRVAAGEDEVRGEDKKRWSFGWTWRERAQGPSAKAWRSDLYLESEKERNRHAIVVAAATAAAADAAVAAAQAAAAVVKLTNYGRRMVEEWAALKIQCVFRGHLARKALMALRALVKLQALVRGHIVRKRVAMNNNIHKRGALDGVDSIGRRRRTRSSVAVPEIKHRRSLERSDESRPEPHSCSLQLRRLSTTTPVDAAPSRSELLHGFDDLPPGTLDIDVGRPKPRTSRAGNSPDQSHLPTPRSRNSQDPDDHCQSSSTTAQSTPRFLNSSIELLCGLTPPVAPRPGGGIWTHLDSPNYMAKTQSFKAKLRSQSVPKLRSEPARRDSSVGTVVGPRATPFCVGVRRSCSQA